MKEHLPGSWRLYGRVVAFVLVAMYAVGAAGHLLPTERPRMLFMTPVFLLFMGGVVHARTLVDEVGGWNPADYFDDYDLWKRMAARHDFHFVNRALCVVRTKADPCLVRLVSKGLKILRHGRRLQDQG